MEKAVMNVDEFEVSAETRKDLETTFTPYFEQARDIKAKAESIVVTSEDQVEEMKEAREMRLQLKKIRVETENKRKEMKAESLRKGKAIDGFANIIKFLIVPIEDHLQEQEDFIKLIEQRRLDDLEKKRADILNGFEEGLADMYKLREMDDETFELIVEKCEREKQDRIEAEKKAEKERVEREAAEAKERERIKKENEQLKKEAEKREKEEAKRLEAERIEREKHEAELAKERKAKEKLEAEIRAKKEAEEKAKREQEEKERAEREAKEKAEREAALAPDKKKLETFAVEITNISLPELKSKEAIAVLKKAVSMIGEVSVFIKEKSMEL